MQRAQADMLFYHSPRFGAWKYSCVTRGSMSAWVLCVSWCNLGLSFG